MSKIVERLKKILALAQAGEAGERVTAHNLLQSLLAKHGLTLADISDDEEERQKRPFSWSTKWEFKLLCQLMGCMFDNDRPMFKHRQKGKKTCLIPTTRAEAVELELRYSIHRRNFKQQLEAFWIAYLMKNDLLLAAGEDEPPISDEEREKYMNAAMMSEGVQQAQIHKQISGAG